MKYFLDTEFIEGFYKPLFGKRRHFIDLISIGIVCEDGREYYAVSSEYNEKNANQWVKDNVIHEIFKEACNHPDGLLGFEKQFIKSNAQIAKDIIAFCKPGVRGIDPKAPNLLWPGGQLLVNGIPEFYGYYSDYDWVLFCSLFGTMMDLPQGFPMYCRDLKQSLDEANQQLQKVGIDNALLNCEFHSFTMDNNDSNKRLEYQCHNDYPKETNEHHALADARWNMALHKFLEHL